MKIFYIFFFFNLLYDVQMEFVHYPNLPSTTESTTGENTTGQSTTGQSTSGENTTGQSTIGQSTTGENTTGQSTTGQSTTGQSTTGQSTTWENKTTGPNTTYETTTRENKTTEYPTALNITTKSFIPRKEDMLLIEDIHFLGIPVVLCDNNKETNINFIKHYTSHLNRTNSTIKTDKTLYLTQDYIDLTIAELKNKSINETGIVSSKIILETLLSPYTSSLVIINDKFITYFILHYLKEYLIEKHFPKIFIISKHTRWDPHKFFVYDIGSSMLSSAYADMLDNGQTFRKSKFARKMKNAGSDNNKIFVKNAEAIVLKKFKGVNRRGKTRWSLADESYKDLY